MRGLLRSGNLFAKQLYTNLKPKKVIDMTNLPPRMRHEGLPYTSQFTSPELVGEIVLRGLQASQDPRWAESGAISPEEYDLWAWNLCGIACLKSILEYTQTPGYDQPTVDLAKRCMEFEGYKRREDGGIDGLFYRQFLDFIRTDFGLEGRVAAPLTIPEIVTELNNQNFVIASVHPTIRDQSPPPRQGGHLVLIAGYDLTDPNHPLLTYHDPAGLYGKSQEFAQIPFDTFENYFANRGVIIESTS